MGTTPKAFPLGWGGTNLSSRSKGFVSRGYVLCDLCRRYSQSVA